MPRAFALLLAVAVAGCGSTAPAVSGGVEQASVVPAADVKPAAIVPKVAAAGTRPKPVAPVEYESLVALLPLVDGWTTRDQHGEQVTAPVAAARADITYEQDLSHVELEIVDSGRNELLLAPLSVFLADGYSERSASGFRRSVRIGGQPGFEDWHEPSRRGSVTVVVSDRFIVRATGHDVGSMEPVRRVADAVDVKALAALR
jgi:hypothetical protein